MNTSKDMALATIQKALGRLIHLTMRGLWRFAKEHGITMAQMMALRQIYYRGECNISEIGEELGVTQAASSQLLDRLVQLGLVTRFENPQDRRNKQIILTDKGTRLLSESMLARQQWLAALYERLSPEEVEIVLPAMEILIEKTAGLDLA